MKCRKTYGVNGILEWQAVIHCGKLNMRVPFTNGSMTAYGVAPATYTTEDAFTQSVIEGSEYFKKGKIILYHTDQLDAPTEEVKEEIKEKKVVEVADIQEAKEYLVENCAMRAAGLRSVASIKSAAEANGIEFKGI